MIPVILLNRGGANVNKVNPVVKSSNINNNSNQKKDSNEQKKNDVKTTAALLRIQT